MEIVNQKLLADTRWYWTEDVADYSAADFTLRYILKNSAGTELTINSTASGTTHVLTVEKTSQASLTAGLYAFQAFAVDKTDATKIYPIDLGTVEIYADIDDTADSRTFAMKMVENLRAAILALSSKTLSSFSIDGRAYQYKDIGELNAQLALWERKSGITKKKRHLIQFNGD